MRIILEFDGHEIAAAQSWHGGQYTLLYAVASTGTLAFNYSDIADAEEHFLCCLSSEASAAMEAAVEQGEMEHFEALTSIQAKCEDKIKELRQ